MSDFYKVEAWSQDGVRIEALPYAGNNLRKAQEIDHPVACCRGGRMNRQGW